MCAPHLPDVALHHADGVRQDVPGQPLDLLAEGGAEQESCWGEDGRLTHGSD